jgi:hypothetical protein
MHSITAASLAYSAGNRIRGHACRDPGCTTQAARHRARRSAGLCCGSDSRQRTYRRLRVSEVGWSAPALLPNRLELCAAVDTSVNYYSHLAARPLNQNIIQRPQSVRLSQYRDTVPELAVAPLLGAASSRVLTCRKTPPAGRTAPRDGHHGARCQTSPAPVAQAQRRDRYPDTAWYARLSRGSGHTFARLRCATEVCVNAPTHNRVPVQRARPDAITRAGIGKRLGRLPAGGAVGEGLGCGNTVMATFSPARESRHGNRAAHPCSD